MSSYSKSEAIAVEPSPASTSEGPALSPKIIGRFGFGCYLVPLFYLAFAACFWATSSLHTGMSGELGFPVSSDEQNWWEAFFYIDPLRVYTSLFYQIGYLLSQALGIPGSFLGFQIVFGLLVWGRAVLLFLIIHRTVPSSFWFAFTAGTIELFHAADGLTNWLGQINQHNYIYWLYLSLYCMAEAFRANQAVVKIALSFASALAVYLCMWSYEAALMLAYTGPVVILVGGKRTRGERITWLDGLCLLIPWSVLAWYTFENLEKYIIVGAQFSYQYSHLLNRFDILKITGDLIFNVYHSLAFWTWLPERLSGSDIGNGVLASALWIFAALFASRSRADELVPPPRTLVAFLLSGVFGLAAALSAFIVLDVSRSLARTQFLSATPASLVWASLLWLGMYPLRRYRHLARFATALCVSLIVFFGAAAGYQYGEANKSDWDRFRGAYSALLRTVPDLLPGTVLVMIAPEARAPAYQDLWFDAGLRLAYPQTLVKGTSWFANHQPIEAQDLVLKGPDWIWQRKNFYLGTEIPFENTVIVELNETGEASVLDEVPSFISEDDRNRDVYHPYSRILCGAPSQIAINRYQLLAPPGAPKCAEPTGQAIKVARASFGLNCFRKSWAKPISTLITLGNETKRVRRICHGLSRCEFDIVAGTFDNPLQACADKEFVISWTCGESAQIHTTRVVSAVGKHVELFCDPS